MPELPADLIDPHPARLDPARSDHAAIVAVHRRALANGQAGYLDPSTGLFVFGAGYLWERGTCCASGCRHCPYVGRRPPI